MKERNLQNLPKEWKWVKLGDIAKWGSGGTPSTKNANYYDGDIPWLVIGDLNDDYISTSEKRISKEGLENSSAKMVPPNNVLIAMYGSIGKLGINKIPLATNQAIAFTQQLVNTVNNKYLFYYLLSIRNRLYQLGKGGTQRNISQTVLKDVDFPLAPLNTQLKIVSKIEELFSELDKAIEQLKTAQQQLKTYRQAVLKWAFEGRLTNENVKEGELPEGWKWVKIDEVADCLDSKRRPVNKEERLKRQGNVPYYGANGRTGWIDDYLFDEPLILVVEDETFVGRELPFSYIITGKSWVNNHAHILKPKNNNSISFLNHQLAYYPFLPLTTGTTGRKKLTKNALMNAPVKICSIHEQGKIVAEIESRLSVADRLDESITQSLQQAETARQSILKKAFEGKLISS